MIFSVTLLAFFTYLTNLCSQIEGLNKMVNEEEDKKDEDEDKKDEEN